MDTFNIFAISFVISVMVNMMAFLVFTGFSCGGREHCGKRFCPIGLYEDHPFLIGIIFFLGLFSLLMIINK